MILYWVVPYLLVAAPFVIVLFAIVLGGCAMTRTAGDQAYQSRFYSDPKNAIRSPFTGAVLGSSGGAPPPSATDPKTGHTVRFINGGWQ